MKSDKIKRPLFYIVDLIFYLGLLMSCISSPANAQENKRCLIIASYHDGFTGQQLKVEGARRVLAGKCTILTPKNGEDVQFETVLRLLSIFLFARVY
ncbi:Uncharacterised protein [Candidatus Venteria ishoeyi]|uniref:Uncharacterized protein n=1 Tax=Candidatus Venteria ishoeyi TaxID=1899563 RepID=A0A1H6FEA8_9GAMM|nr:Uncharacterised protein [Candidatus Venteria ishoeyi]SEH07496.1 Uncharacterised protein [Candidatus Venteria ishoeyi]